MKTDISFNRINQLAVPALIAGIAEPLLSITDLAIVGNINENATESIAAIGVVGAFVSMLIWVFGQTRSAISSIISRYLGANRLEEVSNLPAQAIGVILMISLFILALCYPFAREIFTFYNAKGLILDYSVTYFKIRIFGFPLTLLVIAVFGIFRGLQNTKDPMIVALIGGIINVVLDLILVYGIKGVIPAMNLEGAAYASVIAQLVMAVISVYFLFTKTTVSLRFELPFNKEIKSFVLMVLNLFVRTISLNVALYLATSFATSYGKNYIAAYTIGFNLWLTGAFMIDGYSSAANILAGKLYGANNFEALQKLSKNMIFYGVLFGGLLALIGFIFYFPIGRVFTHEQDVLSIFYSSFWLILLMQPLCSVAFIFDGIYKGIGWAKQLRNILLLATFLVFLPIVYALDAYGLKLHAIWITFYFWVIARGVFLFYLFNRRFKEFKVKLM